MTNPSGMKNPMRGEYITHLNSISISSNQGVFQEAFGFADLSEMGILPNDLPNSSDLTIQCILPVHPVYSLVAPSRNTKGVVKVRKNLEDFHPAKNILQEGSCECKPAAHSNAWWKTIAALPSHEPTTYAPSSIGASSPNKSTTVSLASPQIILRNFWRLLFPFFQFLLRGFLILVVIWGLLKRILKC